MLGMQSQDKTPHLFIGSDRRIGIVGKLQPGEQEQLVHFAVEAYGFVLKDGSITFPAVVSLNQFAEKIGNVYDTSEPRNAAIVKALLSANGSSDEQEQVRERQRA